MEVTHPFPAPAEEPSPRWWRVGRATIGFLLDMLTIGRSDALDIVDTLIMTVVVDANVAPINQDNELGARYATLEDAPPDELRRPVSVNSVAGSLQLPYETVRRRIARLVEMGALVSTSRGIVAPAFIMHGPLYDPPAIARYERLRALYFELKSLGVLDPGQLLVNDTPGYSRPPIRAANRAVSEYLLRVVEAIMRAVGDPLSGLVLLEMGRANAEHLDPIERQVEGPLPDEHRTPVSALELARRCGLPAETVRRHVQSLEAAGFCRRVKGGRLAAVERLARRPGQGHGLAENFQNLQRLFQRCAALGVIAYWESESGMTRVGAPG